MNPEISDSMIQLLRITMLQWFLHNQEIDISKNIEALDRQISNWGYPEHTIHTGPLIRRESV